MKTEKIYKDIDLDFSANPLTGDISKKTGIEAVKQSLKNILNYSIYEKPYNKEFDVGVRNLLFENKGSGFIDFLKSRIKAIVAAYEPRLIINDVIIDPKMDSNELKITISYTAIESQSKDSLELFLGRYNVWRK